jgi:hypothetical protein
LSINDIQVTDVNHSKVKVKGQIFVAMEKFCHKGYSSEI